MRLTAHGVRREPRTDADESGPSRAGRVAIVAAALLAVFGLDRVSGAVPAQHLYYVPIVLAALWFGTRGALGASFSAIALYHLANPKLLALPYRDTDLVQVVLFVAIGLTTARLAENARRLRTLAMTDDLTGLHNLRSFEPALAAFVVSARRTGGPLSLLVLDVDRLKSINDVHGHLAGAEAVRTVGHILAARLPRTAVACRYGGDEFVVALPDATAERARAIADDVRAHVQATAPTLAGLDFPAGALSISVGCAALPPGGRDDEAAADALFRQADRALYEAKAAGRNRVAVLEARSSERTCLVP